VRYQAALHPVAAAARIDAEDASTGNYLDSLSHRPERRTGPSIPGRSTMNYFLALPAFFVATALAGGDTFFLAG
jgi:hypothetical protein